PVRNVRCGTPVHPRDAARAVPQCAEPGTTAGANAPRGDQRATGSRPSLRARTGRILRHRFDRPANLEPTDQVPIWTDRVTSLEPTRARAIGPTRARTLGPTRVSWI